VPLAGADPFWALCWRRSQCHRLGLQHLVSMGRHHGFESLAEARTLLALDFAGDLIDVVSQPMRLRFEAGGASPTGSTGTCPGSRSASSSHCLLASSQGWPSPSANVGSACQTI